MVNEIYKVYETKAACIKAEINSLKNTIQYHKIEIRENQKEIKNAEKTMKKLQALKGAKK